MKRLIIIGNGFDLAHGLKTSYLDFIHQYLLDCFGKARSAYTNFEDDLVRIKLNQEVGSHPDVTRYELRELLSFTEKVKDNPGYTDLTLQEIQDIQKSRPYKLDVKSIFIQRILDQCQNARWVDIENEYYSVLKDIVQQNGLNSSGQIINLNTAMGAITRILNDYMAGMKIKATITGMENIIRQKILPEETKSGFLSNNGIPESTLILNFNYTSTLNMYKKILSPSVEVINIHGSANDKKNPVVFGFGDELDPDYPKLENQRHNGSLQFVKSFAYAMTSGYHNLVKFTASGEFQTFILGHSCGLSDRTMLNMVLEHENCSSIKIFYHQHKNGNNFRELTEEISRHFRDKGEMRKRIVPFERSEPMPQAKN